MVMGYIIKIHWHQILLIQMKKTHWGWREREREREGYEINSNGDKKKGTTKNIKGAKEREERSLLSSPP